MLDAEDESLRRWKESLGIVPTAGGTLDPNAPKVGENLTQLVIHSLALESSAIPANSLGFQLDRPGDVERASKTPLTIPEGIEYAVVIRFTYVIVLTSVGREVLSGLKYLHVVRRAGIPGRFNGLRSRPPGRNDRLVLAACRAVCEAVCTECRAQWLSCAERDQQRPQSVRACADAVLWTTTASSMPISLGRSRWVPLQLTLVDKGIVESMYRCRGRYAARGRCASRWRAWRISCALRSRSAASRSLGSVTQPGELGWGESAGGVCTRSSSW